MFRTNIQSESRSTKSDYFTVGQSYTQKKMEEALQKEKERKAHSLRFLRKIVSFYQEHYPTSMLGKIHDNPRKSITLSKSEDLEEVLDFLDEKELLAIFDISQYYSDEKQLGKPDAMEKKWQEEHEKIIITPVMESEYRSYLFTLTKKRIPGGRYIEKYNKLLLEREENEKQIQEIEAKILQERELFEKRLKTQLKKTQKEKKEKKESKIEEIQEPKTFKCDICQRDDFKSKNGLKLHQKTHVKDFDKEMNEGEAL